MRVRVLLVSSALVALSPVVAAAQEYSGGVTLGYGHTDVSDSDTDANILTLDGRFGVDLGNGLRFGADISGANVDIDGAADDLDQSVVGIYGAYGFANGTSAGLYVERADVDDDLTLTSYGLMLGYEAEGAALGGFYGESDTDPALPNGGDVQDYGVTFRYTGAEGYTVGASALRTEISSNGRELNYDFAGIAGSYAVAPSWTLFGGLSDISLDELELDVTTLGLGVSYDLSAVSRANASVSLEVARSETEVSGLEGDETSVRLGLSIPLGSRGFVVPMNSVADSVLNPRHSAMSTSMMSAY